MSAPIVFAASSALPDRAFRDLPELARWLVSRRDRAWPGAAFVLRACTLGRDALPAGGCIAVHVRSHAGIHRLGYAFVGAPGRQGAVPALINCLRAALDAAEAANAVRQQEDQHAA